MVKMETLGAPFGTCEAFLISEFIVVMHGANDLGTLTKTESYWVGKFQREIFC